MTLHLYRSHLFYLQSKKIGNKTQAMNREVNMSMWMMLRDTWLQKYKTFPAYINNIEIILPNLLQEFLIYQEKINVLTMLIDVICSFLGKNANRVN